MKEKDERKRFSDISSIIYEQIDLIHKLYQYQQ